MDFVVPVAVKLVALQPNPREFSIVDLGSRRVDAVINFGTNLEALGGGGGGDEIDYDFETDERFPSPILADEAEQPVFDFVPLAGARRKVTNGNP